MSVSQSLQAAIRSLEKAHDQLRSTSTLREESFEHITDILDTVEETLEDVRGLLDSVEVLD